MFSIDFFFVSKRSVVGLLAMSLIGLTACDNEQPQTLQPAAEVNSNVEISNEPQTVEPSATEVTNVKYNIFNKEDLAGTINIEQQGNLFKSKLEMGWNNRVVNTDEIVTVDEKGYITSHSISGVSAFGAPVDEVFTVKDGKAQWKSTSEQGESQTDGEKFYVAVNGGGLSGSLLVKTLLEDEDNKVDLLPSGSASLIKLNSITLNNGAEDKTVHLIGVVGLGFTPNFAWYDDDNNFFATDGGGWFGVIPEGWGREHLEILSAEQIKANNDYLKQLSQELTHEVDAPIFITNVDYVDVEKGELVENTNILVANGKIQEIGKELDLAKNTLIIDAEGKTLIPGLWDMHGHLSKSDGLLNIPAGVTNVRDMGNTHDNIVDIEKLGEAGEIIGGDVYRAGFMDRESPYAMKMGKTVDSLESAKAAVDWYAEQGYPQIKTYSSMEPDWMKPLAEHIHQKGMRLSGHIPAFMTAEEAVDAGFDEIQHINMLFLNFLGKNIDTRQRLRFSIVGEQAHELDLDSKEVEDFLDKLHKKGTVVDPTVSTFRSLFRRGAMVDPEIAAVYEHLPANVARGYTTSIMDISNEQREAYDKSSDALVAMVKKLYDKGVQVVPGTDAIAGFTLHRELELYADGGIPNHEVLKMATIGSAKVVGADDKVGSISVGKQADLVFVDGNPLVDISVLRNIALVIKEQRIYKPDEIYQAIGVKPFTQSIDIAVDEEVESAK